MRCSGESGAEFRFWLSIGCMYAYPTTTTRAQVGLVCFGENAKSEVDSPSICHKSEAGVALAHFSSCLLIISKKWHAFLSVINQIVLIKY